MEHRDGSRERDALLTTIGELAIAVWHLGHLVEELGAALGIDIAGQSASRAREAVRRHLGSEVLPPWSRARADRISDWLDQVDECVGAYHDVVQVFATAASRTPSRRLADGARRPVRAEDLKALLAAAQELSRTGDHLVDQLGLQVEPGSVVHGYDTIAHTLYAAYQARKAAEPAGV